MPPDRTDVYRPLPARLAVAALAALVSCTVAAAPPGAVPSVRVDFDGTDEPIANPERGFHGRVELERPDADELAAQQRAGLTLVHAYVRLDAYVERDLPASFLATLATGFAEVRRAGLKVILRFTYNFPDDLDDPASIRDAPVERVIGHIGQLAALLRRHADVIAFLEAGFVGAWGEWHTSSHGLDHPGSKRRIRDALLAALPPGRIVMFRRPADLVDWYGTAQWSSEPAPGTPAARSGVHDDCFLSSPTDAGTFPVDRPGLRATTQRAAAHVPFGGETCEIPPARGACADILAEGREHRVTYLNHRYHRPPFHERWAAEGCLGQVERALGHRLRLASISLPTIVRRGGHAAVELRLHNDGWARPYNPRDVVFRLEPRDGAPVIELKAHGADRRRWQPTPPGSPPVVERLRVRVPATLPAGEYAVSIGFPDPAPSLAGDPRQAIRPANRDRPEAGQRWEPETARFRTGASLTVR